MQTDFKQKIRFTGALFFFALLAGYAYFRGFTLLHGDTMQIQGLTEGIHITTPFVSLSGSIDHAISLRVNGRNVSTNQDGDFTDELVLLPGYNITTIESRDKFGHVNQKIMRTYYQPNTAPSVALGK